MSRHRHNASPDQTPPRLPQCLVTLEPLEVEGVSAAGQRELAGGRGQFPDHLEISRGDIVQHRMEHMQRMSISGMQDKISLRLERARLVPVERDGTHILKPIPATQFKLVEDLPANEHITMLIAKSLGIRTAACGLIRMADEELAYVTRRFDRKADGSRFFQEDFGALAGMSAEKNGGNWKYDYSYEALGSLVSKHCAAQQRDLQEFYRRVAFCFLIGNGDAHVRNFSVLRDEAGLVQLSPAYDLVNTSVHLPSDSELGLSLIGKDGTGKFTPSYEALGFHSHSDFIELGNVIGVPSAIAKRILHELSNKEARDTIDDLVGRSYLSTAAKDAYLSTVEDRADKFAQTK